MIGALALGAGIAATGSAVSSWLTNRSVSEQNDLMREREDNAIQRRVADLQAAGLSPTLSAGSAASAQSGQSKQYGGVESAFDFTNKYLSLVQGKADIDKTNADAALADMQKTSEMFKNAFIQAQTKGEELRNSWLNADIASQLGLRDMQGRKVGAEIERLNADTALLNAKTAYEQANTDFLSTQKENLIQQTENLKTQNSLGLVNIDNAKINRDIAINNRSWNNAFNQSKIFSNFASGNPLSMISGGLGSLGSIIDRAFPRLNLDNDQDKWYYPY